jgi:cobalt/nickel transport system permease protein
MAHIPDGLLSAPVLITGALASAALTALAIRRLDEEQIPRAAVIAAAFFVASLVHIPIGPTSVHPLLTGLMGLVLGWAAVPAIVVGLALQAAFFGFGGLTALGVNACNMAIPALVVAAALRRPLSRTQQPRAAFAWGAIAGSVGVVLVALMVMAALALSGSQYQPALPLVLASFGPLALVEGIVTGAAVVLIRQVKPELLGFAGPAHG